MADKYIFHNNYASTLAAPLAIGAGSCQVVDAGSLATPPSGYRLVLTLINPADFSDVEIIRVTAVSGTTLTITKNQEGTGDKAWPAGTLIQARVTAAMLDGMAQGFDGGGDAKGANATELQRGRDSSDRVASGDESLTAGWNNKASGFGSVATGRDNNATGQYSHAAGSGNTASGVLSQASGYNNIASGYGAIAQGQESVASGQYAIAKGNNAVSAGQDSTAEGREAKVLQLADLDLWQAETAYAVRSIVRLAGTANIALVCVAGGESGAIEPAATADTYVSDGSATWMAADVGSTSAWAVAKGQGAIAIGNHAVAMGSGAIAVGKESIAVGPSATAVGYRAVAKGLSSRVYGADNKGTDVGPAHPVIGRTVHTTNVHGGSKYAAFSFCAHYPGFEFIDQHDWWYVGSADEDETRVQTTKETTLYSIPIQLGDAGWPGAAQTVKHGQSIREGSYIYTAYIYGDNYFDEGVTGGTEPTWPTTPGDDVSDGDVSWICVDPASIEFLLPDYARFTPTQVGVIAKWSTPGGSVVYPQLTFGVNGDLDQWLAATTFSKLTGDNSSHFVEPTATAGAKQFGAALTTPGADLDCTAVIVIKGYVIESQDA